MKKKNQTTIEKTSGERIPDKTKEYVIGNTIYIVNSFFAENGKNTVKDIVERLAVREINKKPHRFEIPTESHLLDFDFA